MSNKQGPSILMTKELWDDVVAHDEELKRRKQFASAPRFRLDKKTGLFVPTSEEELSQLVDAHGKGWVSNKTLGTFVGIDWAKEESSFRQEVLGEFVTEDMATSKNKQAKREREQARRRKSYNARCHTEVRGKVRYVHVGSKIQYEHDGKIIHDQFVNPPEATLLISDGACGRCPLSLVCLSHRSWKSLDARFAFFRCDRCQAVGFVDRMLRRDKRMLFVCFLLRNGRAAGPWSNTRNARSKTAPIVDRSLMGGGAFAHDEVKLFVRGDIPFGCITRCRDEYGDHAFRNLPDECDCRTTIQNGINRVHRY